jgi:CRISPR-associated protein (TIGR02710 family)
MNNHSPNQSKVTAMLVSVGSTEPPILHVLRTYRPKHVWYFCSADSRTQAEKIQEQLDWHPAPRFIEVDRFEELGPCYRILRQKIRDILAETKVPPEEVLVDYTGGTKTMSAALVLAAVELFHQFSYVGGHRRDKGRLGIVLDGEEHVLYQGNPWAELAIREIERARDLWAACQFENTAETLRAVAPKVPLQRRFEAIATLADAMAARHRLDFSGAARRLYEAINRLRPIFEGKPTPNPLTIAEQTKKLCDECAADTANQKLLRELLDNALRTAAQSRYEDAAARLYRAMEMQAQIWLAEKTAGLFVNGRCKPENVNQLPDALKTLPFCRPNDRGEIKLSFEQCLLALAAIGHPQAKAIKADIDLGEKSRFRTATEKRNASILAHGVQPIGRDGFDQMTKIASEFFGFDLSREENPIPPLDPAWFE